MQVSEPNYEVYALCYSRRPGEKASHFFQYGIYDEDDATQPSGLDYFFWVVRDDDRTVLVDCGFSAEQAAARGRTQDRDPLEMLGRIDVSAEDVDHVVVSHLHYDHAGNIGRFPNATFSIAREELDFWSGPYGRRELLAWTVDSADVETVQSLQREGRLQVVETSSQLFPGIQVTTVPGHTPGQMITRVDTRGGALVLASDALHYYEEMDRDRPYAFFHDIEGMYRTYEVLRELDAQPDVTVVAGHDPLVMTRFTTVADDIVDLTAPVR